MERLRDGMRRAATEIEASDPHLASRLRICACCTDTYRRCDTCEVADPEA